MRSWPRRRRSPCWRSWRCGSGFFIVGYACMLEPTTHGFSGAFTQATVVLFRWGPRTPAVRPNRAVDIAAGATWAVVVALQIAYLPSLYDAFSRRESLVAMLESRAGLPAWGPEVLARHQLVGIIDTLPEFYSDWERWAADLAESHTTYPVLLLFRSPEPWYSWVVGPVGRARRGRACTWRCRPRAPSSQVPAVPAHGLHRPQPDRQDAGVEPWTRTPTPRGRIALTFEEFEQAVHMLDRDRLPHRTQRRGGLAGLRRVAGELRDRSPTASPIAWWRLRRRGPDPAPICVPGPSHHGDRRKGRLAGFRARPKPVAGGRHGHHEEKDGSPTSCGASTRRGVSRVEAASCPRARR